MSSINTGDVAWMLTASAMVLLMTPGLAFFYGGMVKRKNVINTMMSSAFMIGLGSILWVLIGFSLSFSGDGLFIGNLRWIGMNLTETVDSARYLPNTVTFAIFQMMFAIITPALISGAVAERMRFSSLFVFATVWMIVVYYPLAHMVWGGGFLQQLGVLDFAGGLVVHVSSGISALVAAIWLGGRKNFGKAKYHPHNVPFVFLGASLLWFGWFGFNAGSAGAANELAIHSFITTNTSGAAAMLSWLLIEKIKTGRPTLVGLSTGMVLGLATVTQASGYVPIWAALIIGLLASPIAYFFISVVKNRFNYDDSLDAFGCHGIGGIWGAIATGLFAHKGFNPVSSLDAVRWNGLVYGETTLFLRQLLSIVVTAGLAIVGTLFALWIAQLLTGKLRVSARDEDRGLDLAEHDESAYPAYNGLD
ncbi:MAG: ammonium transporter [Eubacteriales bacterium]|nr:ammonium transporter [Eubacteriales bacterium]